MPSPEERLVRAEAWRDRVHFREVREDRLDCHGPARVLSCPTCGRSVDAQATCVACGDETDVERDGPDADRSCPRSEGSSALAGEAVSSAGGAVAARLAERPEDVAA